MNRIELSMVVVNFDYDESYLNSCFGLKPTKTWKKGDKISEHGSINHKVNGWEYNSVSSQGFHLDDGIREFFDKFKFNADAMSTIDCELSVVIYMTEANSAFPSINFNQDLIKTFSMLNISLDIDIVKSY